MHCSKWSCFWPCKHFNSVDEVRISVHYMPNSILTHDHHTTMCLLNISLHTESWPLTWSLSPFPATTSCNILERLSTRFWFVALEICAHTTTRALMMPGEKGWHTVGVPFHPKDHWGWCQGPVHFTKGLPPWITMFLWALLCLQGFCYPETCLYIIVPVRGSTNITHITLSHCNMWNK